MKIIRASFFRGGLQEDYNRVSSEIKGKGDCSGRSLSLLRFLWNYKDLLKSRKIRVQIPCRIGALT